VQPAHLLAAPRRGEAGDWGRISADHPLFCVLFRSGTLPFDNDRYLAWQREMQRQYDLVGHDHYPIIRVSRWAVSRRRYDRDLPVRAEASPTPARRCS